MGWQVSCERWNKWERRVRGNGWYGGGGLEGRTREREGVSHEGGNCERGNKKRIEGTGVIRKSVL